MVAPPELLTRPALVAAALIALLVQGLLVVGLTVLATRMLRSSPAAARCGVWNWAFAALLLLPAAPLVLVRWHVPLFIADADPYLSSWVPMQGGRYLGTAIALILLGGVAACFLRIGRDAASIAAITRRSVELPAAPATRLAHALVAEHDVGRRVRVVYTSALTVPATWGLWRPVILLPAGARDWGVERARAVLGHELAHVRRLDYAAHLAAEIACALHWLNPVVRWAAGRLRCEQEAACDDEVLRAGTRPCEYAGILLEFARDGGTGRPVGRCALPMAGSAALTRRVRGILEYSSNRPAAPRLAIFCLGCALLACALTASSVSLWTCAPPSPDSDAIATPATAH